MPSPPRVAVRHPDRYADVIVDAENGDDCLMVVIVAAQAIL